MASRRPLYSGAQNATADPSRHPHWGLWFDKFCDTWINAGNAWSMAAPQGDARATNPRQAWLQTLTHRALGEPSALHEHALRQATLTQSMGGRSWVVETTSPFLTGAGRPHPVENGLAFHPTLGTPFMPGSGVKGMLRAAATEMGISDTELTTLFGNPPRTDAQVGGLVCLDLVPLEPTSMMIDILTPHYGDWVQARSLDPGDWHSPIPVPFLAVKPGARFLLSLFPNPNAALQRGLNDATDTERRAWWEDWQTFIQDTLALYGAGAKTMVGYGRFKIMPDDALRQEVTERTERRRLAALSPQDRVAHATAAMSAQQRLHKADELRQNRLPPSEAPLWHDALRRHPDFELWRRGERPDPALNLSADKLKERADALLTDAERQEADTLSPEQEMNKLLDRLKRSEVEPIPAMLEALQPGRWPQRQLQTLFRWLKKELGKNPKGQKKKLMDDLERLSKKSD